MKKRTVMVVALLCLALLWPATEAAAQKSGRVERLLACLVENDTDKFQKTREKLDEESLRNFPAEVELIDAMNSLWNARKPQAALPYFQSYQQAMQKAFPAICTKEKVDVARLRTRTEEAILALLTASDNKLAYSKQLLNAIDSTRYPLPQEALERIRHTREEALLADITLRPQAAQCEVYLAEFPQGRFLHPVMSHYNDALYQALHPAATAEGFGRYFTNAPVNKFFGSADNRRYMAEARSLYDDFLYRRIEQSADLTAMKSAIDEYRNAPHLRAADRKHLERLEYKSDSVDYLLLVQEVKSAEQLALIGEYLRTHRYKEFRDKAQALRATFEEQIIWTAPSFMRSYSRGKLIKSNEVKPTQTLSTTYSYSDKGELGNTITTVTEKGQERVLLSNSFFDVHGHCVLEVQVDQHTKKELYRRTRQITPEGRILTDTLLYNDGRMLLRTHDANGRVTEENEFRTGKLTCSTAHRYDAQGRRIRSDYTYTMPDTPQPTHVLSQSELCEYNPYGYLTRKHIEKVMANNEKLQGVQTFLYDEYGNAIDSNAYYEYDSTGRWIRKILAADPGVVEYVQCIYR